MVRLRWWTYRIHRIGTAHDRRPLVAPGVSLFQEDSGRAALHLVWNLLLEEDLFHVQSLSDQTLDEQMALSFLQVGL